MLVFWGDRKGWCCRSQHVSASDHTNKQVPTGYHREHMVVGPQDIVEAKMAFRIPDHQFWGPRRSGRCSSTAVIRCLEILLRCVRYRAKV